MVKLKSSLILLIFFCLLLHLQLVFAQYPEQADSPSTQPGFTQKAGDVLLFAVPVATLGTSLIIGDEKGPWQFTKGFLTTELVTLGLKLAVNKQRPDLSNENSFPSAHTATVFHSAGFIHRRYGLKYSLPAYFLAGVTAASRIDSKKHDLVDVMAGAAIGLGSNLLFTTPYLGEYVEFNITKTKGTYAVNLIYRF